ncbi:MAG TPA: glycoside hydrolase family 3 C-terminal domain-containing protein, partial [Candidatus Nanopelagicales bacterium]
MAALPLPERIRLVSGASFWTTHEVPGQVPSVMLTDGPHGLRKQAGNRDHVGLSAAVPATCFPPAVTLGCTWDVDLLEAVGAALGREAAAEDVAVLLGPGLNLKRHPRGGRCFEYLAEDPVLSGLLAAALVRGIQSQGVAACVKHYAANNQETNRMVVDAVIDERTLYELYLRGFELAVQRGAPAALMTAYNLVNGQYAGESARLMREVLRDAWGYDGLVVSDWGAVDDRVAGLAVGLDLEMPGGSGAFDAEVAAAVADGRLPEEALDAAAVRVASMALHWSEVRAAQHEPDADHAAHHALARRAAAAGCVLLQNDGVLPLAAGASVALIGAFADEPRYQGAGSSQVTPTRVDALRPALAGELGQSLRYAAGYDPLTGASTPALMAQAAAAARASEVAIVLVGLPSRLESEGFDRAGLRLPPDHEHLLEVVLDANPRTVVVLVGGGVVELPWADRPAAVLAAWLGGQAGGSALADVLLGVVEPGGRLAESIPVDGTALPASRNFPGEPRQVQYRERHLVGYRFHDTAAVPARFPFGHGLGYTAWQVDDVRLTGAGTDLTVHARVTNVGARPGSQVVQVYVGRAGASAVARPAKELRGFAKVHLDAGASTEVTIELDRRSFTVWDVATKEWVVEAGRYELLVGTSSTQLHGRLPVVLESDDVVAPEPPVADL